MDKMRGGFVCIQNELARMPKSKLSLEAFKVYCIIKSYDPSFPSYSKLEEDSGLGRKCIAKVIKELVEGRLISYVKGNSTRKSNVYRVLEPTSIRRKLVSQGNQFPTETSTSIPGKLELVAQGNSKKTNIKRTIKKTNIVSDDQVKNLFDAYQEIRAHELKEDQISLVKSRVVKKLKNYSFEEILQAIDNYKIARAGWYTHTYNLWDFLSGPGSLRFFGKSFSAEDYREDYQNSSPRNNLKEKADDLLKKALGIGRYGSLRDGLNEWEFKIVQNLPGGSSTIFNSNPNYQFKTIDIIKKTMEQFG